MPDRNKDLEKLKTLAEFHSITLNWFEGGGGEVHRVYDTYILFEIPMYGGEPIYVGTYCVKDFDEILNIVYTWT